MGGKLEKPVAHCWLVKGSGYPVLLSTTIPMVFLFCRLGRVVTNMLQYEHSFRNGKLNVKFAVSHSSLHGNWIAVRL